MMPNNGSAKQKPRFGGVLPRHVRRIEIDVPIEVL